MKHGFKTFAAKTNPLPTNRVKPSKKETPGSFKPGDRVYWISEYEGKSIGTIISVENDYIWADWVYASGYTSHGWMPADALKLYTE